MYRPSIADLVHGSAPLRRRQLSARMLARLLGRIEASGVERVPATGPVVLAVNHQAFLDGPLLFALLPRPVAFLVKIEAYTPRAAPVLNGTGQIPVVRDTWNIAAVRHSLRLLHAGGVVGVFPEGTRGDGRVRTAKPGVGYFALRTGAPVLPVAATGTYEMAHRRGVRRPLATLTFGELIRVDRAPDDVPLNRRVVAAVTEQIRVRLAALVAEADARAAALSAMRAFQEDAEVAS
jgi:1-acyl-sn-glycerol-3-phosphate acyltransferase